MKKRITIITLAIALVATLVTPVGVSAESTLIKTEMTGVRSVFNISKTAKASDKITITNPAGRTLLVQKKIKSSWKTYRKVKLGSKSKQTVNVTYPKQWKSSTYSTWRILVPEKKESDIAFSEARKTVKFIVINRVKMGVKSAAAVILDKDGYILYSKRPNQKRVQASTTKLMTALVSMEKYNEKAVVRISGKASKSLWQSHPFRKGMKFRKETMMHALLLSSYNSAAVALAENKSGSVKKFAQLMNKKAKGLKLKNTRYKNPHGLYQKGHYSSALDTARLIKECYKYKVFRRVAGRNSYPIKTVKGKRIGTARSTYSALKKKVGKSLKAGKTGYEDRGHSGRSFAGVYKINGKLYYIATLGAQGYYYSATSKCWNDHKKLYKYVKKYGNY